jgi:hypothetical protein
MRFLIRSRMTPGLGYLVDLESYNLNGECGCGHFEFRLRPLLGMQREPEPSDRTRCWHILRARGWLLDRFMARLSAHLEAPRNPDTHPGHQVQNWTRNAVARSAQPQTHVKVKA